MSGRRRADRFPVAAQAHVAAAARHLRGHMGRGRASHRRTAGPGRQIGLGIVLTVYGMLGADIDVNCRSGRVGALAFAPDRDDDRRDRGDRRVYMIPAVPYLQALRGSRRTIWCRRWGCRSRSRHWRWGCCSCRTARCTRRWRRPRCSRGAGADRHAARVIGCGGGRVPKRSACASSPARWCWVLTWPCVQWI